MSNPYGGGYQPYDPQPRQPGQPEQHGEPPYGTPGPYGGGNPYGATNPYGAGTPDLDGLSIASLVCSLTCCLAPVGIGLGIAGLVRTKGGQRSGRWAAVTGLVIGILVALAVIAFVVFAGVVGTRAVWAEDARVGQCADVSEILDLTKADCDEPHDAELVAVDQFDGATLAAYEVRSTREFCELEADPRYTDAIANGDYVLDVYVDAFDPSEPDRGDWYICYLERADGGSLTAPISD